jgi:hypothetical protein
MKGIGLFVLTLLAVSLASLAEDVKIPESYVAEESFPVALTSASGDEIAVTVTRRKSVESIPFWVEYEVTGLEEDATVIWMMERPIPQEDPITEEVQGEAARFVSPSNAWDHTIKIRVTVDDRLYRWQEIVDFPLHNLTEILLDAAQFGATPQDSVSWSAVNGDPEDEATFPIANRASAQAKLVSEWPNVLTISCEVTTEGGSRRNETVEALIYFRDGTPFEIRSVASTVNHPMPMNDLYAVWDQEFSFLRNLGVNAITTHLYWYFGPPDEEGNWSIHPIWQSGTAWPFDPRGNTILTADLERLVIRAHQEGFRVLVEMRARPYWTNQSIEWDYTTWDSATRTSHSFRATEAWWFGGGEGFANFLSSYLDEFIRLDIDGVFMGVEDGAVEQSGGKKTQDFYSNVVEQYREAGFAGLISYANAFFGDDAMNVNPELLIPGASGIPYEDMDAVASTYYPVLADMPNSTTLEMQEAVRNDIEVFFRPRSDAYRLPTIVEDCYCQAYADCAMDPLQTSGVVDEECSRRYFTAILREFARANIDSESPWIAGLTMAEYKIMMDRYVGDFFEGGGLPSPWLNESGGKTALQLTLKAFYSDKPIEETK